MQKVPAVSDTNPPTPASTRTRMRHKLWLAAPVAAVLTIGFTGSALARQGADDRTGGSTVTSVDVSGPCDEAENANDPRCAGLSVASTASTASTTSTTVGSAASEREFTASSTTVRPLPL